MAGKTLVPTMLQEATKLSQHMTQFQAYKAGFFEDNADLLAAVANCAECLVNLIQELSAVRERGD